ncbi:hypothetical protein, variant [Saprolegnia diclina VS20]|nr:hypothetical protein, variant [Saprolegnia diclina VS20]EQC31748.1 hypothetical protein, variant [Saprolegnia diclina VS20]|eukprot:XP_008614755.1 hypothetical protein, variant [Saprolegnia diclina VS20]
MTCTFLGCDRPAVPGTARCVSHKNKIKCSIDGCTNQVYARYLCVRHGGKKQCQMLGCDAAVTRGSFCVEHGGSAAKRYCIELGCDRQAHARFRCVRHGGGRHCKVEGCNLHARSSGACHRHMPPRNGTKTKKSHALSRRTRPALCSTDHVLSYDVSALPAWTTPLDGIDYSILNLLCEAPKLLAGRGNSPRSAPYESSFCRYGG